MPDRVKMPSNVPSCYKTVYKQVCEQQDPISTAGTFIRATKKHIRQLGSGGNQIIAKLKSCLLPYSSGSLLHGLSVDWAELHDKIDLLAMDVKGNRFDIAWALEAGHQVLIKIEKGELIDISSQLDIERYIAIWKAYIEEPPQATKKDALSETTQQYFRAVRQSIADEFGNSFQNTKKLSTGELLSEDIFRL